MTARALLYGLSLLLGAAWPRSLYVESMYHRSLDAYNQGRYETALEGFMEVLLEEPGYGEAQRYLSLTGRAILDAEKAKVAEESARIIAEIKELQGVDSVLRRKAEDEEAWRRGLKGALEFARDPRGLKAAVAAYEQVLDAFPIYAGSLKAFSNANDDFQVAFLHTQWESRGGVVVASDRVAQESLHRLNVKELRIARVLKASDAALSRFKRKEYARSAEFWKTVLKYRPENPEALYFLARCLAHLRSETRPVPAPPPVQPSKPPVQEKPAPRPRKPALEAPKLVLPPVAEHAREVAAPAPIPGPTAQEHYRKGLMAYSVGDLDGAVKSWRQCLDLDPGHPKAKKALERALREKK